MKLPSVFAVASLALTATACLLPHELKAEAAYRQNGFMPKRVATRTENRGDMPVGQGDRFQGGDVVPEGLGVDDRDLKSILNINEIKSGLQALAKAYDDVEFFTAPYTTHDGNHLYGVTLKGDDPIRPHAFVTAGIHARERGGPDNVLYFIADLLHARENGTGLTYGNVSYTNDQILNALTPGIIFMPLVNPDGVAHDQAHSDCWRKNRNPNNSSDEDDIGVDLNRNFDFLWDYHKYFNPNISLIGSIASDQRSSEVYHGASALSEPETKNVAWIFLENPFIGRFLDLHSFGGDVLFGWGDDNPQGHNKTVNFTNPLYDGKRGYIGVDPPYSRYREYEDGNDFAAERDLAKHMVYAMLDVKNETAEGHVPWRFIETVDLYATSGISVDYARSRYYGRHCGYAKTLGVTVEFGYSSDAVASCPFYPNPDQYHDWMREVSVGLMEFALDAARAGEPVTWAC